MSDMFLRWAT